jgi:hypothetical protein
MSQVPRFSGITTATVTALREDSGVLDAVYGVTDTDVPNTTNDRQRIRQSHPMTSQDAPVVLSVWVVGSGGEHDGPVVSNTRLMQCSAVVTQSFHKRHGSLALTAVLDAIEARLESPVLDGVYPRGPSGTSGEAEMQDGSDRLMVSIDYEVETLHTAY